jgi:hypothetical protein
VAKRKPNRIITMYYVELTYKEEVFYKIGLSKNTTNRFKQFRPYKVRELETITGAAIKMVNLEGEFKQMISDTKINYQPKHDFPGRHECFLW